MTSGYAFGEEPFQLNGKLELFEPFWGNLEKSRKDKWYTRDYLMYGREQDALIWYYAVPDDFEQDVSPWEVVEMEGGLYASGIAIADDFEDEQRVFGAIRQYIQASEVFELDERENHYDLCTVITPEEVAAAQGYSQMDILVPVKLKKNK